MRKVKPISILVVGLSRMDWDFNVKPFAVNPHYRVTGVVDDVPERRRKAAAVYGCATFSSLEKALDGNVAEMVAVCSHNAYHYRDAARALAAARHVAVKMPVAQSIGQLDGLLAAARRKGRILAPYPEWDSEKVVLLARKVIDSKVLGRVFWIRFNALHFARRNDWRAVRRLGGGMLNDPALEYVNSLFRLLDSPVCEVWGYASHNVSVGDAEDFARISLLGKNGRLAEFASSEACAFGEFDCLVSGTNGAMLINQDTAVIRHFDPRDAPPPKLLISEDAERMQRQYDRILWQEKAMLVETMVSKSFFLDSLYKSIRRGARLPVAMESVRESMLILQKLHKQLAAKQKRLHR